MLSSLRDENRHLPKQIGCIHSMFRLFGRRHFLAARNMSSHHLLPGVQQQLEPHNARTAVIEKDLEAHKMKPGASSDSSQPSTSYSSSPSSTFSSLNSSRQIDTPKIPSQKTTIKETKVRQSPDVRGVVKDSMYREARHAPIKNLADDDRKVKHVDSPRPAQQSKFRKPKASVYEGTKDERMALPRSSYDGRESRDTVKTSMKINELPRFSLDSKASSIKCSALNSSLNFLGRDESQNSRQVPPVNQESGSHSRSNSIVAKLMGLETLSDSIATDESLITKTNSIPSPRESSTTAEAKKQKQVPSSLPVSQNPASPSPRLHNDNSLRKQITCLRVPVEPAPWKQQNSSRGSPKPRIAARSGKASENSPRPSSVYGEIEKRIAELEFKRSGKDLRALKQILEAMQKTRERLQSQKDESDEPKIQERSNLGMETPHVQKIQSQDPKYHRENSAQNEKSGYRTPRNNNMREANQRFPSIEKKICRNFVEQTLDAPQPIQVENNTTPTKGLKMVAPRVRYNVVKTEREPHPNKSISESGTIRKQTSKKVRENCPKKRNDRVKSTDLQPSDERLSSHSSETRYSTYHGDTASTKSESNSSIASHIETEVISLTTSISLHPREQQDYALISKEDMPAVKLTVPTMEQPSPVSVLDTPFCDDCSPSPVKKISTAFLDESSSSDEAERQLENPNHLSDCAKCDSGYKYNQKSENQFYFIQEANFFKIEANETARDHSKSVHHSIFQGHGYLTKTLLASGLLKNTSIIQIADQLHSSCHLINSNTFHVLEATEGLMKEAIGELIEKNDQMKLNQKIQEKIVPDLINEIMARKMTSDGLFNLGWKRTSLQGLIKEAYLEIDHLCRLPYCNLDDGEDDGSIRLVTADMKYQSDDWTDYCREIPALVLDIERLIFKDLINEIVTCEVVGLHDWPKRHCRQLFNK